MEELKLSANKTNWNKILNLLKPLKLDVVHAEIKKDSIYIESVDPCHVCMGTIKIKGDFFNSFVEKKEKLILLPLKELQIMVSKSYGNMIITVKNEIIKEMKMKEKSVLNKDKWIHSVKEEEVVKNEISLISESPHSKLIRRLDIGLEKGNISIPKLKFNNKLVLENIGIISRLLSKHVSNKSEKDKKEQMNISTSKNLMILDYADNHTFEFQIKTNKKRDLGCYSGMYVTSIFKAMSVMGDKAIFRNSKEYPMEITAKDELIQVKYLLAPRIESK